MLGNPLSGLRRCGQSVWLDFIRRRMLEDGELQRLVEQDGVSGITSNPAILQKAISEHDDYRQAIVSLSPGCDSSEALYEALVLEDISRAADGLRSVYEQTGKRDGYVSLEVSPRLARDSAETVAEARRLWSALARPNIMIKVPATLEGLPAIQRLTRQGINVNATLIFSPSRYRQVADAYLAGLEARLAEGEPLQGIASVASFFVSRIDTLVDDRLDRLAAARPELAGTARGLRGKAAVAAARLAYRDFKALREGGRWAALAGAGAGLQRLLWASTSTKDPSYSDVKYVDELVGPETVNTLPPQTLAAYRDHGSPAVHVEDDLGGAEAALAQLEALGIGFDSVADTLERDGVDGFCTAYEALLAGLERLRRRKDPALP